MDQKNTIVKCAKYKCLFNNCGTCDQYVITIGVDNTCQAYTETEGFTFKEQKVCHDDCIHFDDSDPMVGPVCLFKHPEPLKAFYDGMPCEFYHQRLSASLVDIKEYKRGQRAKGNFIEDGWVDPENVEEVCQPFKVKVAELNKPNKNKSILQSEAFVEGINVTAPAPKPGSLNICYWCDYFNSNIKKCYCKNPILTPGECHSCKSTGGNR